MSFTPLSKVCFTRIETDDPRTVVKALADKCQRHAAANNEAKTELNRWDRDSMEWEVYAAPLYFPGEFLRADWYQPVLVRRIDEFSPARVRERFQQMLNEPQHDVITDAHHASQGYYCRACYEGWPGEREWCLAAATFGNDMDVAESFIGKMKQSKLLSRYIPWERLEVGGQQQRWPDLPETQVEWKRPGRFYFLVKLENADTAEELMMDCIEQLEFEVCDLAVRFPIRNVDESLQKLRAEKEPWHVMELSIGAGPTCDILVPQKTTRPVFFPAIEYSDASSIYLNLFAVHTAEGMFLEIQSSEPEFVDELLSDLALTSTRHQGDPFTRWGIEWNEV